MNPFYSLSFSKDCMKQQTRAMFDTNTYEFLYEKEPLSIIKLIKSGFLIVYGCKVIRDELREIPPTVKVDGKNYRNMLLSLYDDFTKNHSYPVEGLAETLAEEYWKEYHGCISKRKMLPDFKIVAVATIHRLDIIVSGDNKTMKAKNAMKAYETANKRNGLETPKFVSIEELC
jgi:HD-GYP domain-containing protein (c-di-GMP phosphodiesterase class II)